MQHFSAFDSEPSQWRTRGRGHKEFISDSADMLAPSIRIPCSSPAVCGDKSCAVKRSTSSAIQSNSKVADPEIFSRKPTRNTCSTCSMGDATGQIDQPRRRQEMSGPEETTCVDNRHGSRTHAVQCSLVLALGSYRNFRSDDF
jgi:hypothetical protein